MANSSPSTRATISERRAEASTAFCNSGQDDITSQMAVSIIQSFEIVDVDKQQSIAAVVPVAAGTPAVNFINEIASVEDWCQRVAHTKLFQFSHTCFERQILAFKS